MARHPYPLTLTLAILLGVGLVGSRGVQPTTARAASAAVPNTNALVSASPDVPSMKNCDGADACAPDLPPHPSATPRLSGPPASNPLPPPSPTPSAGAPSGSAPASVGIVALPSPSPATNSGPPNQGIVAYTNPVLGGTTGPIKPNGTLTVRGFNFGSASGMVQLEGDFPGYGKFPGGVETLQVQSWTDTQVTAVLPNVRGAPDQTAQVLLITAAGVMSNMLDIQFIATRETIAVDGPDLQINCGGGSNLDLCGTPVDASEPQFQIGSLTGVHFSACCINGVNGADEYAITLKNGWQFAKLELNEDGAEDDYLICFGQHPTDTSVCDGTDMGVNGGGLDPVHLLNLLVPGETLFMGAFEGICVTTDARGTFQPDTQPAARAVTIHLKVDWQVNANCSPVVYYGKIWITGPAGVPYH